MIKFYVLVIFILLISHMGAMVHGDTDPSLSAEVTYPHVLYHSKNYTDGAVTIIQKQHYPPQYRGVYSVTVFLATEGGNKIKQLGHQDMIEYEANLLNYNDEVTFIVPIFGRDLSGFEGNYSLMVTAEVFLFRPFWSTDDKPDKEIIVDYIPVTVMKSEFSDEKNGSQTIGFEFGMATLALIIIAVLGKKKNFG